MKVRTLFISLLPALLILGGLLLRVYHLESLAGFDFDQETAAWWVKSFLIDHKLSLIGQEISVGGIFIGPLYFYLLSVFYALFRLNPVAANYLVTLTAVLTMVLLFLTARRLFSRRTAIISLVLYTFSFRLNLYDRTTAPSNLIMFLSLATLYTLIAVKNVTLKGLALGLLFGLAVSVHPTALTLIPISLLILIHNRELSLKLVSLSLMSFLALAAPLILFDIRHGFLNIAGLARLFFSSEISDQAYPLLFKLFINIHSFVSVLRQIIVPSENPLAIVLFILVFISFLRFLTRAGAGGRIFLLWSAVPLIFLSVIKRNVPEYYFLLSFPVFVILLANFLSESVRNLMVLTALLAIFACLNLIALNDYRLPLNMEAKKAVVKTIVADAGHESFSVDYATGPGQNNGFRYLFFLSGETPAKFGARHYIIVTPANLLPDAAGKMFGSIKVIGL